MYLTTCVPLKSAFFFFFFLYFHWASIVFPSSTQRIHFVPLLCLLLRFSRWRILSFSFSFFWIGSSYGFLFFWSPLVASRINIVVPLGGIKPGLLAVKVWSSNQWTARQVPCGLFLKNILTAYRILVWQLFSFSTLKKLFLIFLASIIFVRK